MNRFKGLYGYSGSSSIPSTKIQTTGVTRGKSSFDTSSSWSPGKSFCLKRRLIWCSVNAALKDCKSQTCLKRMRVSLFKSNSLILIQFKPSKL